MGTHARVLVVEDDQVNRILMVKALHRDHHEIRALESGRAILEELRAFQPNVIVLDVTLPDMDGFEICRQIRATGSRVPILFVTGKVEPEERVKGLDAGADDYLIKPYNIEELRARVRALVRRSRTGPSSPISDWRKFLALRLWPFSLTVVFFCLAALSSPFPGLPDSEIYTQTLAWSAAGATALVTIWHAKGVRMAHVFFSFTTCVVRSLFGLIGWTNAPDAWSQLLGSALWGSFALGILTIYLLTLPFVVDEQIEKQLVAV